MLEAVHQTRRHSPSLRIAFVGALVAPLLSCGGGTTQRRDDVRVTPNSINDYYTVRSQEDGSITTRDLPPTPPPREAITRDDYFAVKLEHIYMGGLFERLMDPENEYGNLAIIAEIGGIIPDGIDCNLVPEEELGFALADEGESNSIAPSRCAYKTVVQINPAFNDSHATFDSAFISPPFRTSNRPLELRFIMAELHDLDLARRVVNWLETAVARVTPGDAGGWQQEAVDAGFSAVNYLLDYAAKPGYVFEMTTDFVPVETVEGGVPQNLLMQSDFVIVGLPTTGPPSALLASEALFFNSGRLYYRATREEYRESPYVVFRVVRFGRFPGRLPVNVPDIVRDMRRAEDPMEVQSGIEDLIDNLQYSRLVNETEGTLLRQTLDWVAETAPAIRRLDDEGPFEVPALLADVPPALREGLLPLDDLEEVSEQIDYLDRRLYANFGQTPGFMQDECVALRRFTQEGADAYADVLPDVVRAFEALQIRRSQLQMAGDGRSADEEREYELLRSIEPSLSDRIRGLPGVLAEPDCPALRGEYVPPGAE